MPLERGQLIRKEEVKSSPYYSRLYYYISGKPQQKSLKKNKTPTKTRVFSKVASYKINFYKEIAFIYKK